MDACLFVSFPLNPLVRDLSISCLRLICLCSLSRELWSKNYGLSTDLPSRGLLFTGLSPVGLLSYLNRVDCIGGYC